jgi:hypothetical protein
MSGVPASPRTRRGQMVATWPGSRRAGALASHGTLRGHLVASTAWLASGWRPGLTWHAARLPVGLHGLARAGLVSWPHTARCAVAWWPPRPGSRRAGALASHGTLRGCLVASTAWHAPGSRPVGPQVRSGKQHPLNASTSPPGRAKFGLFLPVWIGVRWRRVVSRQGLLIRRSLVRAQVGEPKKTEEDQRLARECRPFFLAESQNSRPLPQICHS